MSLIIIIIIIIFIVFQEIVSGQMSLSKRGRNTDGKVQSRSVFNKLLIT